MNFFLSILLIHNSKKIALEKKKKEINWTDRGLIFYSDSQFLKKIKPLLSEAAKKSSSTSGPST